jgi:hypothetical protein
MLGLFSAAAVPGRASDGAGGVPGGPDPAVQISTGTAGSHSAGQGTSWELLIVLFAVALLVGAAIMAFVAVQRTKVLAKRRASGYERRTPVLPSLAPELVAALAAALKETADDWRTVAVRAKRFSSKAPMEPAKAERPAKPAKPSKTPRPAAPARPTPLLMPSRALPPSAAKDTTVRSRKRRRVSA